MKKLLLGLCFYLLVIKVEACKCTGGTFIKHAPNSKLVAIIKVNRYLYPNKGSNHPFSMEVEIVEIYQGKEKRKSIVVWGIAARCGVPIQTFKIGEEYILALREGQGIVDNKPDYKSDYFISDCGTHYLSIDTNNRTKYAVGNINDKIIRTDLKDLKNLIIAQKDNNNKN